MTLSTLSFKDERGEYNIFLPGKNPLQQKGDKGKGKGEKGKGKGKSDEQNSKGKGRLALPAVNIELVDPQEGTNVHFSNVRFVSQMALQRRNVNNFIQISGLNFGSLVAHDCG